ncbi:MAG: hypothetical protein PHY48_02580 [Candidatus Cloacimonetes bacterium]|nr:hypothetical protein [Candidatus Cloacimonadota bacterium]
MKRSTLMLMFLFAVTLLVASVGITSVNMEDYSGAVVRVVIGLSANGTYQISSNPGSLDFKLDNFISNSKARIATKDSNLVSAIEQDGDVLHITVKQAYRYETSSFTYPRRVAVDIFKNNPNREERLDIAAFYSDTGKLNSADKTYSDLHIDYRQDSEILYKWAVLLHKRGSSRASEKLFYIPTGAPYFEQAKKLMAVLHGEEEPLPPPPPIAIEETDNVQTPPPVSAEPAKVPEVSALVQTKQAPAICPINWLGVIPKLVLLGFLLAISVIIFVFAVTRKRKPEPEPSPFIKSSTSLDTKTLCSMVSKLLSDGWSMREISKELKISLKEVEQLVQICHSGIHEDQDN